MRRRRDNVLGAVETRDHDFISVRTNGSVNAETICELISKIDLAYPGEEITLVMDNARSQRNRKVAEVAAIPTNPLALSCSTSRPTRRTSTSSSVSGDS